MSNFYVGATVENIHKDSERYGEEATVIAYNPATGIAVQYEDGFVGKAKTASKYYQVVNDRPCTSAEVPCGSNTKTSMNEVFKAVKRALMGANEKALIDTGLVDECGNYSAIALGILAQSAAAADVALGNDSVLVAAAKATLAERKEKSRNN